VRFYAVPCGHRPRCPLTYRVDVVASSAFVHSGEVHAGGESERVGVEHWIVGVEEVVVAHTVEDLATVVGCQ
jgi:hypothetical protein